MAKEILINVRPTETRVALVENGTLLELMVERARQKGLVGSIFRGRVSRVLPGMQAAFVDIGLDRAAFLYVGDVRQEESGALDEQIFLDDSEVPKADYKKSLGGQSEESKVPIQDLLKEGQEILVQVAKDPLGTKGARITTHLSLPGRHIVYMPTLSHIGVSRRIEDEEERERLKALMEKIKPAEGGIIVRTAGEGASEESIKADLDYLIRLSKEVEEAFKKQTEKRLIHAELDVELRAVRDLFTTGVNQVVVDNHKTEEKIRDFAKRFMPQLENKVVLYTHKRPLFDQYDLDLEISRALERKVWLRSGGYIVFDEAEALVVIDVNTGKYVGKKDLEDTILKTNLEAVREIALQLRIRNAGGIIIVDFIDMEKEANREKVLEAVKQELSKDRARTSVLGMSSLGLVELTRKRIRPSLTKALCEPCDYCDGRGFTKTNQTVAHEIFREIEREGGGGASVVVNCHADVADWIYAEAAEVLEFLEARLASRVVLEVDPSFHVEQYEIYSQPGVTRDQ